MTRVFAVPTELVELCSGSSDCSRSTLRDSIGVHSGGKGGEVRASIGNDDKFHNPLCLRALLGAV